MIEISDRRQFARYWFVPGEGCDFMAMMWRDIAEGSLWQITYRFRYYESDDPHDEKDVKNWYNIVFPRGEEEGLSSFEHVVNTKILLSSEFKGATPTVIDLRGKTTEEIIDLLLSQAHTHPVLSAPGGSA